MAYALRDVSPNPNIFHTITINPDYEKMTSVTIRMQCKIPNVVYKDNLTTYQTSVTIDLSICLNNNGKTVIIITEKNQISAEK